MGKGGQLRTAAPLPSRTKAERREYLRAWRARGRDQCDCGAPATVKRGDGEDVCERCALLETRRERAEQRRVWVLNRYGYKHGGIATHGFQIGQLV
jgi:hypothetical protein